MKCLQSKHNNRYDPIKRRPRVPLREEVDWPALPPGEQKKAKPKQPNKCEKRLPSIGYEHPKPNVERRKINKNRYNPIKRRPRVPLKEEVDWPALPPGEQKKTKLKQPDKCEKRLPSIGHKCAKPNAKRGKINERYNLIKRRERVLLKKEVDRPALPPGWVWREIPKRSNKREKKLPSGGHKCVKPNTERGKSNKCKRNEDDYNRDAGEEKPAKIRSEINEGGKECPKKEVPGKFNHKNFTFHKIIGEGGFGKVAMATHNATKRKIAVKAVKKEKLICGDPEYILVEKEVLEKVGNSSMFTHAYGTFQTVDYLLYVMEYLRGGELRKIMKSKCPLPTDTIRFIAAEILCAVQHLHSLGIIHRDLKPGNILLDDSGHVKLADFGFSHAGVFGDKKVEGLAGTAFYIAPEVMDREPYNTAVDYYSLGIILFQMATGLHASTLYCTSDASVFMPDVDGDLQDVIMRLLEQCPRKREEETRNLREHPFFREIDWKKMETGEAVPPFQMSLDPEIDTMKNIDIEELIPHVRGRMQIPPDHKNKFRNFAFVSEKWKKILSEI